MFQALSSKIITGVVTLSMLLLSSYEGNNAKFSSMMASYLGSKIYVNAQLVDAFENDFEKIFKSGQRIDIFFNISIYNKNEIAHEREFRHAVIFDPIKKYYNVFLEEQDVQSVITDYNELLETISHVEYFYNGEKYEGGHVILSAYLKKIKLEHLNKEYDLMMLWKFKKPKMNKLCELSKEEI
ncbi:MAG: hypothetical protein Q7J16_13010 [Candidatus Cloacimonadales bacterium]|nr:hypothetical protein [Candidatus Cloacimonadales bacterium]